MVTTARRLGSYRLIERLGRGGMGEVWRAEHDKLGRQAAVKLIRPEALTSSDGESRRSVVRRFEREAKATAGLSSPNTIRLFDFGSDADGTFYYAMELLVGLDLESLVDRFGPVEPSRVIHFLTQACDSLAEAHQHGLIHRDIKPANIYTCRQGLNFDFVKVLDFGLVKPLPQGGREISQLTVADATTGTPAFMAPEVALGQQPIDGRADLYALGCVAYWLLTRSLVFSADSPMQMVLHHIQTDPAPPSAQSEIDIPADLEAIIMSCLAKSPNDRPRDALEVRQALRGCSVDEPWTNERAESWWRTHIPNLFELRPNLADHPEPTPPSPQSTEIEPESQLEPKAETRPDPEAEPRAEQEPEFELDENAIRPLPKELSHTRHEILHRLRNNFAHSVIDIDEFERRTEQVQSAVTQGELESIVKDLPDLDSDGAMLAPVARPKAEPPAPVEPDRALVPLTDGEHALAKHRWRRGRRVISILSGAFRRGDWEPAQKVRVISVLGGAVLDFRHAKLQPGLTEVSCFALLGGCEIVVPPGLPVFVDGIGILGAFDDSKIQSVKESPQGPMLRVGGLAILGGIDVKTKGPDEPLTSEERRAARKARRDARRQHRVDRYLDK